MDAWFNSLASVLIVSAISLTGVFLTISLRKERLKKILMLLVSFSAGALFAGAFFHLIPEVVEKYGFTIWSSLYLIIGILCFFVLEKFIHWRHCHTPTSRKHPHPLAVMNLVGDGFHNLIDGLVIGGAYIADFSLGFTTTIAIILHEIPQEIGDFGILLHAGFSKKKALLLNLLSASIAIIGAVISLIINARIENYLIFLLPFTAGGFIYIAGSDIIPEMHKECRPAKSMLQFLFFVLGIAVMFGFIFLE